MKAIRSTASRFGATPYQGPDYCQPIRMQARGRSPSALQRWRTLRLLWLAALRSHVVWRRALRASVLVVVLQFLLLDSMQNPSAWRIFLVPLSTLAATLFASAAVFVHAQVSEIVLSRN
jgi:hypothetical protein